MFDSLTTNNLQAGALDYAVHVMNTLKLEDSGEIYQVAIDRLVTRRAHHQDDLNWYLDQMTGRMLGRDLSEVSKAVLEAQQEVAELTVQIAFLCKRYAEHMARKEERAEI